MDPLGNMSAASICVNLFEELPKLLAFEMVVDTELEEEELVRLG